MPKAYLVPHIRVRDPEEFERFKTLSQKAIEDHGCRLLAQDPEPETLEGGVSGTVVLIEFPDRAARAEREVPAETD